MCGLLGVPRSSFYYWRDRVAAETATAARRRMLAAHVARVFRAGRGAYGCRRVAAQLNREGHPCSVGLVADLMRELGLRACQPRAYRRTTIPGQQPVQSPDLVGRNFTADVPGTRLIGAITYLKTDEGWLYLATVIDLATGMVIGWQLADHMRTSLVVDALQMAIRHGHSGPPRSSTATAAPIPHQLHHPSPRTIRRRRLHRSVLQPAASAFHTELPHPDRGPHRLPATPSSVKQPEELSKILDTDQATGSRRHGWHYARHHKLPQQSTGVSLALRDRRPGCGLAGWSSRRSFVR
jgi:HTH-like domain/Integrase core domain